MNAVLLLGGTGFLGRHVASRLAARNLRVIVPTRNRERGRHLLLLPTVELVNANVHDEGMLAELVRRVDAVVNLVGVLHSRHGEPYGPDFARAHVELPRKLVAACDAAGIERLVHVGALGAAADAPSEYLRSKAAGEAVVRAARTPWVILRPSVVFGPEDNFLNLFARLLRIAPVVPLGGAHARLQPVWVGDVATVIEAALSRRDSPGQTYELAGPEVYTLAGLVRFVGELIRRERPVLPLPEGLAWLQALLLEHLPGGPLMSRDNLRSLRVDNVAHCAPLPFGFVPASLARIAPTYLK